MRTRRAAAGLMTAFLLLSCDRTPSGPPEGPLAPAFALSGDVINAGSGTPTIDGLLSPGEWAAAGTIDFDINLPDGGTTSGTWYAMNDGANLYLAVRFPRGPGDTGNGMAFEFDNNADGIYADGNDVIVFSENFRFVDAYRIEVGGIITGVDDVDDGGTTDGSAAFTNDGSFSVYEFSHPLDTADDSHDFSLAPGDYVGASLELHIFDASLRFGGTFFPEPGPQNSLLIHLASASVTLDITPGSASSTINLHTSGMLTVGIPSTASFDATTIDASTVRFGPALAPEAHGRFHPTDLNGDGRTDALLHFRITDTGISAGDTMACIQFRTTAGAAYFACAAITTA